MPVNYDNCEWGREIIVGFDDCGFVILPLIDGGTPELLVAELFQIHTYYGTPAAVEMRFAELVKLHVGKPAGLLAFVGEREKNYESRHESRPTPNAEAARTVAREVGSDPCNMD